MLRPPAYPAAQRALRSCACSDGRRPRHDVPGLVVAEGLAQRHCRQQTAEAAYCLRRAQHHRSTWRCGVNSIAF